MIDREVVHGLISGLLLCHRVYAVKVSSKLPPSTLGLSCLSHEITVGLEVAGVWYVSTQPLRAQVLALGTITEYEALYIGWGICSGVVDKMTRLLARSSEALVY